MTLTKAQFNTIKQSPRQATVTDVEDLCDEIERLRAIALEVRHGNRKVTIYLDSILRSWGTNIDTEMSDEPRSFAADQAAFDWLFEPAATPDEPSDVTDECVHGVRFEDECIVCKQAHRLGTTKESGLVKHDDTDIHCARHWPLKCPGCPECEGITATKGDVRP
jgi:hypothetical protein